jgi:hypothetical protein
MWVNSSPSKTGQLLPLKDRSTPPPQRQVNSSPSKTGQLLPLKDKDRVMHGTLIVGCGLKHYKGTTEKRETARVMRFINKYFLIN